jgi:hypothetical protein
MCLGIPLGQVLLDLLLKRYSLLPFLFSVPPVLSQALWAFQGHMQALHGFCD